MWGIRKNILVVFAAAAAAAEPWNWFVQPVSSGLSFIKMMNNRHVIKGSFTTSSQLPNSCRGHFWRSTTLGKSEFPSCATNATLKTEVCWGEPEQLSDTSASFNGVNNCFHNSISTFSKKYKMQTNKFLVNLIYVCFDNQMMSAKKVFLGNFA